MSLRLIDLSSLLRHHAVSNTWRRMRRRHQRMSPRNGDELAEARLKPIQLHLFDLGISQCTYLIMISGSGLAVQ